MALFKFRKGTEDTAKPAQMTESVEAVRKRAKQRLIGAVVLVLAGVIGFPLLVDNQPRPIAVNIPIDIPDRNKVKPLSPPVSSQLPQVSGPVLQAPPAAPVKPEPKAEPKPEAKPLPKPEVKPEAKPPADNGAKAQAILEGQEPPKPAVSAANAAPAAPTTEERYIVQFGAYADPAKAREARLKVEGVGLKTYSQMVETKEGKRYRVRVGPYATQAEAEKAAEQIKKLDFPASILTL
jgi:DedD protein